MIFTEEAFAVGDVEFVGSLAFPLEVAVQVSPNPLVLESNLLENVATSTPLPSTAIVLPPMYRAPE